MGDLEKRLERLEGVLAPERGEPCRKCGAIIPYVICEKGETSYPFGKPCGSCGGSEGVRVLKVVVDGDDGD